MTSHGTWDPAAPGVVELPSGRLVRGRSLRLPVPDGVGTGERALRLWRSHAAGIGPELEDGLAGATMLVRLHHDVEMAATEDM